MGCFVIPAKAGIQGLTVRFMVIHWTPASAGVTVKSSQFLNRFLDHPSESMRT